MKQQVSVAVDSSWSFRPLGDVFDVVGGGTPSKRSTAYYDGNIPWATIRDMNAEHLSTTEHTISLEGLKNSSAKLIPAGEVIMASRVGLGKACILKQDTAINQDIRALIPKTPEDIERKFCLYWLQSITDRIVSAGSGATVQGIRLPFIKSLPFPFINREQQKRVVEMLDQALAALDCARGHAEANLKDCREIFSVAASSIVERMSKGRQERLRLGSIVTRLTNGYVGATRNIYVDSGIPYLLARHVRDNTLTFDGRTHVSPEFNEKNKKSKLKAGDVLLVQSGHIGHCAVVPEEHDGHNCHAMIVITTLDDVISGPYLSAIFNTPYMQDEFQRIRTGSTVPHLTCKMVRELLIDVPPRQVQDEIMDEIETLKKRTHALQFRYAKDLNNIADLRQSLLHKAFSGQLT
ncbi:restriction endonuclease subunit S [Oleiagrimonas sp. MCCC 1A03011]|uniref:restriction endonuclease subunit S n=1 Tax=Oleiagrimonas sp. MCCC 1A03011 TaxID=1926883 RepID=UPI000DC293BC|nr:restriction endonuclease subunit S [Oleiagrimonas sp. MCCC 1A03011]RAP59217.1 hypothetical protein BTJ49_00585 [Oleiagrimonas sp. MCCC 1A03011]